MDIQSYEAHASADFITQSLGVLRKEIDQYGIIVEKDWNTLQPDLNNCDEKGEYLGNAKNYTAVRLWTMLKKAEEIVCKTENCKDELIHKLEGWKSDQKRMAGGEKECIQLEEIQRNFNDFVELINIYGQKLHLVINQIDVNHTEGVIPDTEKAKLEGTVKLFENRISKIINCLLADAFIVETHPQIVCSSKRFSIKIRHLAGSLLTLTSVNSSPEISASLENHTVINEYLISQQKFSKTENMVFQKENTRLMYDDKDRAYVAYLKKCKVNFVCRASKEKVYEKLYLLIDVVNSTIPICAISRPLMFVSHSVQLSTAEGILLWENAFGDIDGESRSSSSPKDVSWVTFFSVVSKWFCLHTGRALDASHEAVLRKRLFGETCLDMVTLQNILSINEGYKHSFWEWLNAIRRLIKKHLLDMWNSGHIVGFIHKYEVDELLSTHPDGTFIIRFSETMLGAVSVPYKTASEVFSGRPIWHSMPWNANELELVCLERRIINFKNYKHLCILTENGAQLKSKSDVFHCMKTNKRLECGSPFFVLNKKFKSEIE